MESWSLNAIRVVTAAVPPEAPAAGAAESAARRNSYRPERIGQCAQGTTAVTHCVFFVWRELRESASTCVEWSENGVVTKTGLSTSLRGDHTFTDAGNHEFTTIWPAHQHNGSESGIPLPRFGCPAGFELTQDTRNIVLITGVFTGETRGTNAGGPAECIDFKAGVVGHGRKPRCVTDSNGLQTGVAFECVGVFNHFGHRIGPRDQRHSAGSQDLRDLRNLVGIGARTDEFHEVSATDCPGVRGIGDE